MNNGVNGPSPVTQSQFNPKPTGATATGTQTPTPAPAIVTPTPAPAPAVQTPSEVESLKADAAKWKNEYEKKTREEIARRRSHESERQTWGEKLKDADWAARIRKLAKADELTAARELFGENALQRLNELAANGGAPTAAGAAMVAEQAAKDAVDKLRAEQAEKERAAQESERQEVATHRQQAAAEGAMLYENLGAKEFPLLGALGNKDQIGGVLLNQLTPAELARYRHAIKVDDVDARVSMMKTVAARVESQLERVAELATGHEKYANKLREKLTAGQKVGNVANASAAPSVAAQSVAVQSVAAQGQSQRRSLNNDMTGSTQTNAPDILSDDERMKRAIAKYHEAVAAKGKA